MWTRTIFQLALTGIAAVMIAAAQPVGAEGGLDRTDQTGVQAPRKPAQKPISKKTSNFVGSWLLKICKPSAPLTKKASHQVQVLDKDIRNISLEITDNEKRAKAEDARARKHERRAEQLNEKRVKLGQKRQNLARQADAIGRQLTQGRDARGKPLSASARDKLKRKMAKLRREERALADEDAKARKDVRRWRNTARKVRNRAEKLRQTAAKLKTTRDAWRKRLKVLCR